MHHDDQRVGVRACVVPALRRRRTARACLQNKKKAAPRSMTNKDWCVVYKDIEK
jgi:hypothetical protein